MGTGIAVVAGCTVVAAPALPAGRLLAVGCRNSDGGNGRLMTDDDDGAALVEEADLGATRLTGAMIRSMSFLVNQFPLECAT